MFCSGVVASIQPPSCQGSRVQGCSGQDMQKVVASMLLQRVLLQLVLHERWLLLRIYDQRSADHRGPDTHEGPISFLEFRHLVLISFCIQN